jgi:hypothetical protein
MWRVYCKDEIGYFCIQSIDTVFYNNIEEENHGISFI